MIQQISKTDRQIRKLASDYARILNEGAFVRNGMSADDIAAELQSASSSDAVVKIVVGGKFYDVKDVYTIEDDDTSPYICIEGE